MSLSETQNGDVSEETVGGGKVKKSLKQSMNKGLSEAQNGDTSEETVGGRKVKKSLKRSMNVGLSEVQNGNISKETVENIKVKKSKKSTILINGEAATQPPNSESKKKKKKKRKIVDDAEPGKYFIFFEFKLNFFTDVILPFLYYYCVCITCKNPQYSLVYQELAWELKEKGSGRILIFLKLSSNVSCCYIP